jgi:hypothetical protein
MGGSMKKSMRKNKNKSLKRNKGLKDKITHDSLVKKYFNLFGYKMAPNPRPNPRTLMSKETMLKMRMSNPMSNPMRMSNPRSSMTQSAFLRLRNQMSNPKMRNVMSKNSMTRSAFMRLRKQMPRTRSRR